MSFQILPAGLTDLPLLRDFAEHCFRVAYEADNEADNFEAYCAQAFTLEKFQEEFGHPFSKFWLVWLDGALVAYLKLNFDHHHLGLHSQATVQVERIYVDPSLQGKGLGAQVLSFAFEQAVAAGAEWIWLSVWQENPRAVRFYERCGYEIFDTDVFQLGTDPQIDWAMRKKIDAPSGIHPKNQAIDAD